MNFQKNSFKIRNIFFRFIAWLLINHRPVKSIKALQSLIIIFAMASFVFPLKKALAAEDVLCTTFPVYLFSKTIAEGSKTFNIKLMLDSALGCPHDYSPSPSDIGLISRSKILIINGMGLESFLLRPLALAPNDLKLIDSSAYGSIIKKSQNKLILNKNEALELLESYNSRAAFKEGKEAINSHPSRDAASESKALRMSNALSSGHSGHGGINPHLFASPSSAMALSSNIAAALSEIDPANAKIYQSNANNIFTKLQKIKQQMDNFTSKHKNVKIFISHSIVENYAKDLGFEIAASIEEEDGAEPSAARLTQLLKTARQEGIKTILAAPESNLNLLQTLADEAAIPLIVLDLGATGPKEAEFDYYQKIMDSNLNKILKTLK